MELPGYIENGIKMLENAGYEAYVVGGAVRDVLLGRTPSDWDIATSATPQEMLSVFEDQRVIQIGIKHGTLIVLFSEGEKVYPTEITTFRVDGKYLDSRHPESVTFTRSLLDDLSRRDFTVNAMAYNPKTGIIDLYGGRDDIKNRKIRAVGKPSKRFAEDSLRVLRAYRFCGQLNFILEDNTFIASMFPPPEMKYLSRERVGCEIKKMICAQNTRRGIGLFSKSNGWKMLFDVEGFDEDVVEEISSMSETVFEARLSVLICQYSKEDRMKFMDSLRLSNAEKRLTLRLCAIKKTDFLNSYSDMGVAARKFLHLYNDVLKSALEVFLFWNMTPEGEALTNLIIEERKKNRCLRVSDLALRGEDILPLTNGRYAIVGVVLAALLEEVIADPSLNEKDILLARAKEISEQLLSEQAT